MKLTHAVSAMALLLLLLPSSPVSAQATTPDLVGTWKLVSGEVAHWSGALSTMDEGAATLEVHEQRGGVFRGVMSYRNNPSGPQFEGKAGISHDQSEVVLGVVEWDGQSIILVDYEDETVHKARLINPNLMEVVAFEPGPHAVVNRMILVKQ